MKDALLKKDVENYLAQLPPHVAEREAAKLLNRCRQKIETLEDVTKEMALMLDFLHSCIATEAMPVLNSECDEKILGLLVRAGKKPTLNAAGEQYGS